MLRQNHPLPPNFIVLYKQLMPVSCSSHTVFQVQLYMLLPALYVLLPVQVHHAAGFR